MIVLSGALVLVALVLLVFGAVDRNLPYVYASIGVSLLSLLLLLVGILQRRGELTGEEGDAATTPVTDTSAERAPALVGADREQAGADRSEVTAELATPVPVDAPASRRIAPTPPAEDRSADEGPPDAVHEDVEHEDVQHEDVEEADVEAGDVEDDGLEDDGLEDDGLEDDGGSGVTVLVVSGRPRYHLEGCRVLRGKEPQPLDRDDARTHGFTPCGVCKPDADETSPQDGASARQDDASFTEALFGESIFADRPAAGAEPSALPDRPVQPVLPDVDPGPASPPDEPVVDPASELRGEDPADDPTSVTGPQGRAEVPVAGDEESVPADVVVDEPVEEPVVEEPVVEEPVVEEPVVEPVADVDVPVAVVPPVEGEPSGEPVDDDELERPRTADAEAADAVGDDRGEEPPAPGLSGLAAAEQAPVEQAPVKTAAATKAPAKKAAAKKAPAKKATAKKAPAKTASAKAAPAKKAPAKRAPAEQAPAAPAPAPEPQVRRPMVRTVRADALRLGTPSAGATTTRVSARAAAPAAGGSVVVVPDRDRFHRPECRFARDVAGATTLPKASAARQGYTACGVCKP